MSGPGPAPSNIPPSVEGIVSRPSQSPVEETLERLREVIRSRGLILFAHIDHGGEARRVGLEMRQAHVLIFGNPTGGTPLMIVRPLVALDLPLKALVWQGADDRVWVSYNDAAYLTARYHLPVELAGPLAMVAAVVEAALRG